MLIYQQNNIIDSMILFEKYTLANGLIVLLHQDLNAPFVIFNTLYKVGSRNETPDNTGLAHLFEHLMFGGSKNAKDFDDEIFKASGDNNAFTSTDITNYYITVPAPNIATCAWLESDRMTSLSLNQKSIDTQRKVVCEEFNEGYINQPYGDTMHLLFDLCYTVHPYKYPVIGKNIEQIKEVKNEIVKQFYKNNYAPNNAIISVGGNMDIEKTKELIDTYFGDIPAVSIQKIDVIEPKQTAKRSLKKTANVPTKAIYKAWHCCNRASEQYYIMDLITDILGNGKSSRLYQQLVKKNQLFSEIDCYHNGTIDAGLLIIEGKINSNYSYEDAEKAIDEVIQSLVNQRLEDNELQRYKNKAEAQIEFNKLQLINRVIDLAYFEMLGDAQFINHENEKYAAVSADNIKDYATLMFDHANSNVLYYGN
jgi:predicted Zn-dependent peptidase